MAMFQAKARCTLAGCHAAFPAITWYIGVKFAMWTKSEQIEKSAKGGMFSPDPEPLRRLRLPLLRGYPATPRGKRSGADDALCPAHLAMHS